MNSHRYEKVISSMTSNKTISDSNKFSVSVNGVNDIFEVHDKAKDGEYIFKSQLNGKLHPFIAIPPYHIKYYTNNKTEYIFKSEL